jgi:hypothetical protein
MVIALVALFSSLGGVSYGLAKGSINGREVKNRSLTGKDIKRNSIGGNAVKESTLGTVPSAGTAFVSAGVTHFAAVNRNGEMLARRGALVSFADSPNGDFKVIFDREIRNCAYVATLVNGTPVQGALRGQIGVGLAADDARALQVQTANASGNPTALPFHVAVLC